MKSLISILLTFVLTAGFAQASMIGHWQFDESSGSAASDSSGNGHNGTLYNMNNSDWVTGLYDNGLDFDGADDYVLIYQAVTGLGQYFTKDFTIAAWINASSLSGRQTIVGVESTSAFVSSAFEGFTLELNSARPRLYLAYGDAARNIVSANTTLSSGQWYHICVTRNGGTVTFYINGQQDAAPSVNNVNINFNSAPSWRGYDTVGATYDNYYNRSYYFQGIIDDVRLYNHALSSTEVADLARVYWAYNPNPFNGNANADPALTQMTWDLPAPRKTGDSISAEVYFDTVEQNVIDGDPCSQILAKTADAVSATLPAALTMNTQYFWRVDVYDPNGSGPEIKTDGSVWSFTTTGPAQANLVGHWQFNQSSGSSAPDSSGNGHNGTLIYMEDSDWIVAQLGNGLDFDGLNDYVLIYEAVTGLGQYFTKDFTAAAWINSNYIKSRQAIVSVESTSSYSAYAFEGFSIELIGSRPGLYLAYGNDARDNVMAETELLSNVWYHICVTRSGDTVTFYLDGAEDAVRTVHDFNISFNSDPTFWGYDTVGVIYDNWAEFNYYFQGSIDDVRLYDRALNPSEVANLAAVYKAWRADPADNETNVSPVAQLNWTPGTDAISHNVYFGTDPCSPPGQGNQTNTYFDPCELELETTYYWRIDEVTATETITGDVWSFTTGTWPAFCPPEDTNGDCLINIYDLLFVAQQWLITTDLSNFAALANDWLGQSGPVVISEFMASNSNVLDDEDDDSSDWIELYNSTDTAVDLTGWSLINGADQWYFPDGLSLGAHEFLLVFASGKNRFDPDRLHTNFKLSAGGEYLALVKDDQTIVHAFDPSFPSQNNNISYGLYQDELYYFSQATPGKANVNPVYEGLVKDTKFSVDRGFYEAPFNVTITCETGGSSIYYTTDGSEPTQSSTLYTGSILVNSTTCLRAKAFKTDWMPSNTDTHTYILNASALVKSLPVISIVGDEGKALYESDGIMAIVGGHYDWGRWKANTAADYNNPIHRGRAYERQASVELIESADNSGFQIDCGIRVQGSSAHRPAYTRGEDWFSGSNDKFSFKLYFRSDYGDAKLRYQMFPREAIDVFDRLVLRGGWTVPNPFIIDELVRRLHHNMGGVSSSGSFANIFINGVYRAYYNTCEYVDEAFFQSWYDSDQQWDVITQRTLRDGDFTAWNDMMYYIENNDLSNPTHYLEVANRLDIQAFIDYVIVQLYSGNWDWPNNNWIAGRERSPNGKFTFCVWDAEFGMNSASFNFNDSGLNSLNNPVSRIYRGLKASDEFKMLFADRIQKCFFDNGALVDANVEAEFYELHDNIIGVIPGIDMFIPNTFIPGRRAPMLTEFISEGLFTNNPAAPSFNINGSYQHGGTIDSGDTLSITNPNPPSTTIYYTLDGSDPRQAFTGIAIGTPYTGSITLTKSTRVKARVKNVSQWSPLTEAVYAIRSVTENLRISEIMYHPTDPNAEYIELRNISTTMINPALVEFTNGISFTFPSYQLDPDEYILVAQSPSELAALDPNIPVGVEILGPYTGSLDNAGERIALVDAIGQTIHDFRYKDGWYDITDGQGFSLTVKDPAATDPNLWGDKSGWRPSAAVGGSPGWDDTGVIPQIGAVKINELLAHSDTLLYDWIELHNTTEEVINIGGWFLSDNNNGDPNRMKYEIATGTTIDPNGFLVFYENLHFGNPGDPGTNTPFALSENGETLYLQSGQSGVLTGYYDEEDFGASEPDTAFGRYHKTSTNTFNFVAMSSNTPGSANAYPKVGPVVINEIMYHPQVNPNAEYIELLNISGSPETLYDPLTLEPWQFVDDAGDPTPGLEFYFPSGPPTTIAAGGYFLLIKNLTAFTAEYGAPSSAYAVWTTGSLSNGGEEPLLSKPGDLDNGVRQYIRIDKVNYSDGSHPVVGDPWPTAPDGLGSSLSRKVPANYGNDVANWQAQTPTPGAAN